MLLFLLACKPNTSNPTDSEEDTASGPWVPADQVVGPCDGVRSGPSSTAGVAVDLSAAHALTRFFGTTGDWLTADAALVSATAADGALDPNAVDAYAAGVTDVCAEDATDETLPTGSLTVEDGVGILVPGTGLAMIADDIELLVIDLRSLPATLAGDAALDAAVAASVATDVEMGQQVVRTFYGYPQQYTAGSLYGTSTETETATLTATGARDVPLAFFTGPRTSPHASRVAGALRLAGRAALVGYDLFGQVAESTWQAVGSRGLVVRTGALQHPTLDEDWPDRVPADIGTSTPKLAIDDLRGLTVDVLGGEATRDAMGNYVAAPDVHPDEGVGRGERRAALLVLHGTLVRFWPYFDVASVDLDTALTAAIDEADALVDDDRLGFEHTLGHFMHELYDGHGFYGDFGDDVVADGYVVAQIQAIDGAPVVRTSGDPGLEPGDTIIEIDGTDATAWFDEAMSRRSAATTGYRFDLANREMLTIYGSRSFRVRDPDGVERDVVATAGTLDEYSAWPWGGTMRPSGWLDDLGAPDVYFLNLNGLVTTSDSQFRATKDEYAKASALIVDMRDYPAVNHYAVDQALRDEAFVSPTFEVPLWTGPDERGLDSSHYDFTSDGTWGGPTVLLVSNKTVSAAENFSEMLYDADNFTVMGQHTAGTNGNITLMVLPGLYYAYFTGMRVLNPDGTDLYETGIPVDIEVEPTATDFRDGRDPELEAAVDELLGK